MVLFGWRTTDALFRHEQIQRSLSLLMYPIPVIAAALERAAVEFPDDPSDSEHFLALVLYSLEKEDEFSGDLIIVSGNMSNAFNDFFA